MPSPRVDWALLKSKAADTTALYALTERQATVLLSICQILGWRSTFRVNDYDYSDWDTLQAEVDDLQRGLMMPVYVTDLIAELQAIREAMSVPDPCCTDVTTYEPVTEVDLTGTGDVPQPVIDAGYATGVSDWTGYNEYKCMAAHLFLNVIQNRLIALEPVVTGGFAIFAVLAGLMAIMALSPALVIGGILVEFSAIAALIAALKDPAVGVMSALAATLETNRDDIVCALVGSDGIDDAVNIWGQQVDAIFSDANALLLKSLNIRATLKGFFYGSDGTGDTAGDLATAGYDPADYECCPVVPIASLSWLGGATCTSHNLYDPIALNEDIDLVSVTSGAGDVIYVGFANPDHSGPYGYDQYRLVVTAINGWVQMPAAYKEILNYLRDSGAPDYVGGQFSTQDLTAVPVGTILMTLASNNQVAVGLYGANAYTMTVQLQEIP